MASAGMIAPGQTIEAHDFAAIIDAGYRAIFVAMTGAQRDFIKPDGQTIAIVLMNVVPVVIADLLEAAAIGDAIHRSGAGVYRIAALTFGFAEGLAKAVETGAAAIIAVATIVIIIAAPVTIAAPAAVFIVASAVFRFGRSFLYNLPQGISRCGGGEEHRRSKRNGGNSGVHDVLHHACSKTRACRTGAEPRIHFSYD
jgi:hypothetical protein